MLGFNDILGHEQIKEHFRNAVQTGKVSHAYIPVSYTHLDVYKRQHHHGSLKYESVVGAYTTVTMRFPAADYLRLESPEQTDQVKKDSLWVYEASNIIR